MGTSHRQPNEPVKIEQPDLSDTEAAEPTEPVIEELDPNTFMFANQMVDQFFPITILPDGFHSNFTRNEKIAWFRDKNGERFTGFGMGGSYGKTLTIFNPNFSLNPNFNPKLYR